MSGSIIDRIRNHYLWDLGRDNKALFFVLLFIAVLPVTVSSVMLYYLQSLHEAYNLSAPVTALFFFVITTFTMAFALTPTTFVAVIAGHYFSWTGLLGVVPSYLLAAAIGLLLGRLFRYTIVGNNLMKRPEVREYFRKMGHREFLLIIFGRLSPVLPFAMMNIAFAHMNVKWLYFLSGSLLGMFPRTFLFFWTGKHVSDIWSFLSDPTLDGILQLIPVLLVILSTAGIIWVVRSVLKDMQHTHP